MLTKKNQSCIDACAKCAQACYECFHACLNEPDLNERKNCVSMLVECAMMCQINEMPPEPPLKKCNHLCTDEGYIDSRKVLTRYFEGADGRYQRTKILKELKGEKDNRSKYYF